MWTQDVGRANASNYPLLQVIFEVNLKLFQQNLSKRLLFVLRDFDDRAGNFEKYRGILQKDVDTIWDKIYKPEKFKNSKASDFFVFEFAFLPHKIYQEDKFEAKTTELRGRFAVGASNSLFLADSDQKNIPMDGVPMFVQECWTAIRSDKELNLPDQREMVANFRCSEIKEEAIKHVENDISDLEADCAKSVFEGFGGQSSNILTKATYFYKEASKQYNKESRDKIMSELED